MDFGWRKLNNLLHRDLGYFFFGMTIIYAVSGIALNHIDDWDPNYIIRNEAISVPAATLSGNMDRREVVEILQELGLESGYKSHYYPSEMLLKVFLRNGSLTLDISDGAGRLETVSRRAVFFELNYLHYNHARAGWLWFSDLFAAALVIMATTGLFVLRGKNGLRRRGVWLVIPGLLIPLGFILWYYLSGSA